MGNKKYFVTQKHNSKYWSIYNIVEEGILNINGNYLLFEDEESAIKVCEQLNNSNYFI